MATVKMTGGLVNSTSTPEDLWQTTDMFYNDFMASPFSGDVDNNLYNRADLDKVFWHLMSKYDESHYSYKSDDKCKLKTFHVIHQYLPTYLKRIELQERIRNMTDQDLFDSGKQVVKSANTPDVEEDMNSLSTPQYTDNIQVQNRQSAKLLAIQQQYGSILDNVWDEFIDKFAFLFKKFMFIPYDYIYINEEGDEE